MAFSTRNNSHICSASIQFANQTVHRWANPQVTLPYLFNLEKLAYLHCVNIICVPKRPRMTESAGNVSSPFQPWKTGCKIRMEVRCQLLNEGGESWVANSVNMSIFNMSRICLITKFLLKMRILTCEVAACAHTSGVKVQDEVLQDLFIIISLNCSRGKFWHLLVGP